MVVFSLVRVPLPQPTPTRRGTCLDLLDLKYIRHTIGKMHLELECAWSSSGSLSVHQSKYMVGNWQKCILPESHSEPDHSSSSLAKYMILGSTSASLVVHQSIDGHCASIKSSSIKMYGWKLAQVHLGRQRIMLFFRWNLRDICIHHTLSGWQSPSVAVTMQTKIQILGDSSFCGTPSCLLLLQVIYFGMSTFGEYIESEIEN